jgi:hypothetical protein
MRKLIAVGFSVLKDGLMLVLLISIIGFSSYFISAQPSYADVSTPQQALTEIRNDLAAEDRDALYEEETKAIENPKVGIEKEYEENVDEYYKEHPGEGNVLNKVKDLVSPNDNGKG